MPNEQVIELVVIVAALLQMAKAIPQSQRFKEWFPVVSVALGIGLAFASDIAQPWVTGILIGLSASGGYSFLKVKTKKAPTIEGPRKES